jgi:hypothetical protein
LEESNFFPVVKVTELSFLSRQGNVEGMKAFSLVGETELNCLFTTTGKV